MAGRDKVYTWRQFEFWAQGGRVWILNTKNADDPTKPLKDRCKTISPGELMKRVLSLMADHKDQWASVREEFMKLADDAKKCAMEVKRQGDMTDPAVLEDLSKQRRRSSILMPGDGPMSPPGLKSLTYKIVSEAPEKMFEQGVQVAADIPKLYYA